LTALDLIKSAFTLVNIKTFDESISDAEANAALDTLNMMLDQWKTQQFLLYAIKQHIFQVSANVAEYTIGNGGTWNTTPYDRPVKIESAFVRSSNSDTAVDFKMTQITNKTYADIPLKGFGLSYPTHFEYIPNYPLGTIKLYPYPSQALYAVFNVWQQFTELSTLTTDIDLPPGYLIALRYNLACELIPQYGVPVDRAGYVIRKAKEYKDSLRAVNSEPRMMKFDSALMAGSGRFNIFSGWPNP
jgi:hypothetical protein